MRNRLLVSAAILAAGVTLASAQHAPGTTGQDHPQARKHDANRPPVPQNRRSQNDAARKATQSQHVAKHAGEPAHGETSPHNARSALTTARHSELPPLPPRGLREHGDRHGGTASDRSISNRATAQGRAQSERSTRQHPGRSQATAAAPDDLHGAKVHAKDHTKNHAQSQVAHRPPSHVMGRASEKELKAHSAAPSHPHRDTPSSHAGAQAGVRQAQAALNQQGFNVGDPDGKLGQRTKKALIAFQKQHGFQTTGRVDHTTLEALNAAGRSRAQQTPAPQNAPAVPPATTGQGSVTPAAAQQPTEGEAPPPTAKDGQQLPDASSRVPAGSPQEDYKDDLVPPGNNDQR